MFLLLCPIRYQRRTPDTLTHSPISDHNATPATISAPSFVRFAVLTLLLFVAATAIRASLAMSSSTSWPSLLGRPVAEAISAIKAENPLLNVVAMPDSSFMTMDYREDRVRVMHDAAGKVSQVPRTG